MPTRKPIVGLAGGIGSGKSTVARQMASLGAAVFDADAEARRVLDQPDVVEQLCRWWGDELRTELRRIDRGKLADLVFDDPAKRTQLESLIHPRVAQARERVIAEAQADPEARLIVLDVPLLFEAGWAERCDAVVFVKADRRTRLARLMRNRGWSASELARREKNQMALDKKLDLADYVVDNSDSETECLAQVRSVIERILDTS